jgi:hypothetical protein
MFNADLEDFKFIGDGITVSGIHGSVKRAVSRSCARGCKRTDREMDQCPLDVFRAGLEAYMFLGDTNYLRAGAPVDAPRYLAVAVALDDKIQLDNGSWRIPSVVEVRQERELPFARNDDSLR